jgi:hypothetical protein
VSWSSLPDHLRFKKEDVDARPEAGMTLVDSVLADNSEWSLAK